LSTKFRPKSEKIDLPSSLSTLIFYYTIGAKKKSNPVAINFFDEKKMLSLLCLKKEVQIFILSKNGVISGFLEKRKFSDSCKIN